MLTEKMLRIVVTIVSARLSLQISTTDDAFYSAGVVEFRPSVGFDSETRMLDNLKGYLNILDSEAAKNLDIIVFPESTLNNKEVATFVPNPAKGLIMPCDAQSENYHNFLKQLSCAAKNLSVYMVINLTEKERCNTVSEDTRPCANSGLNLYNTNVVFDRNGAVISRYRKVHLYGEGINTTISSEIGWFDTDFGIRFGHFICFDILFYTPAQHMVIHEGIKNFIFPSMWFSQLPFLTAVQAQQAWSYANDVNLLAAGSSNPSVGSTGTGIYNGRNGILLAKINEGMGERKLYVAQVPKHLYLTKRSLPELSNVTVRLPFKNLTLKTDFLQDYETVLINLTTETSLKQEICFPGSLFCCTFELKWQKLNLMPESKYYHYRLGVYNGWRHEIASETNQLKNCALFSCKSDNIMDCGKVFNTDSDVVFENITITAVFPKAERFLIMPNSLNAQLMPLPVNHIQWQENHHKNTLQVRYELNTTTPNVMAFSIYGNYYDCIVDIMSDQGSVAAATVALTKPFLLFAGFILISSSLKMSYIYQD